MIIINLMLYLTSNLMDDFAECLYHAFIQRFVIDRGSKVFSKFSEQQHMQFLSQVLQVNKTGGEPPENFEFEITEFYPFVTV